MPKRLITAFAFAGLLTGAAYAGPVQGVWGGDRAILTFLSTGAHLQLDCAAGDIGSPVSIDEFGRFSARGHFQLFEAGPQRADDLSPAPRAEYVGKVNGETLTLTVKTEGDPIGHSFSLKRGVRPKLVRCL